jgi:hypothetical protein
MNTKIRLILVGTATAVVLGNADVASADTAPAANRSHGLELQAKRFYGVAPDAKRFHGVRVSGGRWG